MSYSMWRKTCRYRQWKHKVPFWCPPHVDTTKIFLRALAQKRSVVEPRESHQANRRRLNRLGRWQKKSKKQKNCLQHLQFPGGPPSQYWAGSTHVNFRDRTGIGCIMCDMVVGVGCMNKKSSSLQNFTYGVGKKIMLSWMGALPRKKRRKKKKRAGNLKGVQRPESNMKGVQRFIAQEHHEG